MKRELWWVAAVSVALGVGVQIGRSRAAGAPTQAPLTYGGVVSGQDGKPLASAVEVTVAFYDAAVGGSAKCAAAPVQAEAGSGRFSVVLPAACVDAVHEKADLWAEAAVGPNKVVLPRAKVGAVPYALEAD
ncbi:MAG: hypothetical protein FJ100_21615, partial [Deltaproteobacteria bacterium]|nr:hypothetical protein [Deltaproteobacteria bacterium]